MRSILGCFVACLLGVASAFPQESGRVSLGIVLHPVQTIGISQDAVAALPGDSTLFGAHNHSQVVTWVSAISVADTQVYRPDSSNAGPTWHTDGRAMMNEARPIHPVVSQSLRPLPTGWLPLSTEWRDDAPQYASQEDGPVPGAVYLYSVLAR